MVVGRRGLALAVRTETVEVLGQDLLALQGHGLNLAAPQRLVLLALITEIRVRCVPMSGVLVGVGSTETSPNACHWKPGSALATPSESSRSLPGSLYLPGADCRSRVSTVRARYGEAIATRSVPTERCRRLPCSAAKAPLFASCEPSQIVDVRQSEMASRRADRADLRAHDSIMEGPIRG